MYRIPKAILVGYGRVIVTQYVCSSCTVLFFPGKSPFQTLCDSCTEKGKEEPPPTSKVFYIEIVKYIQKTEANQGRRHVPQKKILQRDEFTCRYCNYSPRYCLDDTMLHIDHVVPWSANGSNLMTNLVTACSKCNLFVSNKVFSSFADKRVFIVNHWKKLGRPVSERQWREKYGIHHGNIVWGSTI